MPSPTKPSQPFTEIFLHPACSLPDIQLHAALRTLTKSRCSLGSRPRVSVAFHITSDVGSWSMPTPMFLPQFQSLRELCIATEWCRCGSGLKIPEASWGKYANSVKDGDMSGYQVKDKIRLRKETKPFFREKWGRPKDGLLKNPLTAWDPTDNFVNVPAGLPSRGACCEFCA